VKIITDIISILRDIICICFSQYIPELNIFKFPNICKKIKDYLKIMDLINHCINLQFHDWLLFSGFSDPFVKVRLLPRDKFQHVIKPTTAVQKKTLYPLFDESFKMLVFYNLTATGVH